MAIIREMREAAGMSQNEMLRYFKVSRNTFLKWDQGRNSPPPYVIEMMIKILKYEGIIDEEKFKVLQQRCSEQDDC